MTDQALEDLFKCKNTFRFLESISLNFARCVGISDKGLNCLSEYLNSNHALQNISLDFAMYYQQIFLDFYILLCEGVHKLQIKD